MTLVAPRPCARVPCRLCLHAPLYPLRALPPCTTLPVHHCHRPVFGRFAINSIGTRAELGRRRVQGFWNSRKTCRTLGAAGACDARECWCSKREACSGVGEAELPRCAREGRGGTQNPQANIRGCGTGRCAEGPGNAGEDVACVVYSGSRLTCGGWRRCGRRCAARSGARARVAPAGTPAAAPALPR